MEIAEDHGYIIAKGKPRGTKINLSERSVTATENILMLSTFAEGETKIINSAAEPHVIDLVNFLNAMGARIENSNGLFFIKGVKKLHPVEYSVIPDYLEAGTFMIMTAITGGNVFLREAIAEHSTAEMVKLSEIGVNITKDKVGIRVKCNNRLGACLVKTAPYPGFPTDLQPQICSLLCLSDGTSVIEETMYEERFNHIAELRRMGADIKVDGRIIVINGVKKLDGAEVMASDIRCGAALVLAGLGAKERTEVLRVYHIDRGYEKLDEKLTHLGAVISREQEYQP